MKVDKQGNAYVVGNFGAGSITIDSSTLRNFGPAPTLLAGTTSDCFVAKFRPSGTVEWAFAFGGDKNERIVDIALAPNGTGIFLVGNFESEVLVFSSQAGSPVENVIYGATSRIEFNTFLIRVNPLGKVVWVSQTGDNDVAGMVIDADHDKIYLVGAYPGDPVAVEQSNEVLPNFGSKWSAGLEDDDTDDGTGSGALIRASNAGTTTAIGGGGGLFARNSADIYVDHYSMTTGDLIQGIAFEGDKNDFATDMTLLPSGSALFITGYFYSTRLTLSPVLSLSNEKEAGAGGVLGGGLLGGGGVRALPTGFVVRMDSEFGTVLWGKNLGGVEASPALQVAVDESSQSVFVTGSFLSAGVLALSDGKTAGLLRLSQSTGGIVWARPAPRAAAVAADLMGFVFVAGTYTSPVTWAVGVGLPIPGSNSGDVYLARVKVEDGQVVLTRNFRGGERLAKYGVEAVEIDGGGNVYLGGNYTQGSLGVGGQVLLSPGTNVDGFVGRVLLVSEMSVTMTPGTVLAPLSLPSSSSSSSSVFPSGGIFGDSQKDQTAPAAAAASADAPVSPPDNTPTRSPTMRPTVLPRFRLTWAPTTGSKATITAAGAAPPDTAKAAAAPAATAPATTTTAAVQQSATPAAPPAPAIPTEKMDITLVYAGPASDVNFLQLALYQVLKPHVSSYLSLPAVRIGTGRRRRVLHGRGLAPGEECSNPSSPKIRLRFQVECATEAAAVTVVRLLADISSGKIVLTRGLRTFPTSLICSLSAVETLAVAPPPAAAKEADASTPPPLTPPPLVDKTSDSSSTSHSGLADKEANGGKKKKNTVGVGLAIAFCVLAAVLVAGFVHRKAKKDKEIQAAEEMRDAEWQRTRALERRTEEEARLTGALLVSDVNVSSDETHVGPGSLLAAASPSSYTAVSLEQQEEGRHQEEDG
jgi:hypothetical protein